MRIKIFYYVFDMYTCGSTKKYEAAHRFAFNETEKSEIIENV